MGTSTHPRQSSEDPEGPDSQGPDSQGPDSQGPDSQGRHADSQAAVRLRLEFLGSASEYFRIWALNTAFTLLTLGVFSAWAKVRKKRYFYAHTVLDGTPFQYLGSALPILKGRILAVLLGGLWLVGRHQAGLATYVFPAAALLLAPWIIVKSAAFNLACTAYRNMAFRFTGSLRAAAGALYGWTLLTMGTCGVAYPWLRCSMQRFVTSNTEYGEGRGRLFAEGGDYFKAHLIAGLYTVAFVLPAAALGAAFSDSSERLSPSMLSFLGLLYLAYTAGYGVMQSRLLRIVWNSSEIGGISFRASFDDLTMAGIYASNALAIVMSAGLLTPWASIRLARYKLSCLEVWQEEDLETFRGHPSNAVAAYGAEVGDFFDLEFSL